MDHFWDRSPHVWRPHTGQKEFLENAAKVKVLACGRRWGKTDVCAASIVDKLLQEAPTKHLLIAPTQDQANLLFNRVVELLEKLNVDCKTRKSPYPFLRCGEHVVRARSGHIPKHLRGNEATDIVIDEAAFLPEEVITDVAMPMLATSDGQLTLISTPFGMNHFWRFFMMGETGEQGVWSKRAPTSESPFIRPDFLSVQRQLISERTFRVEYEAEFLDPATQVFSTEAVQACCVAALSDDFEEPVMIGVDWAAYGDHSAVAIVSGNREACELRAIKRIDHGDPQYQVASVAAIVNQYNAPLVLFDRGGIGLGLMEQAHIQMPQAVRKFVQFSTAFKQNVIENLKFLIEWGRLKMLPDPYLMRELSYFRAEVRSGSIRYEAMGSEHDDLVIALALAASWLISGSGGILVGRPKTG